MSTDAMSTENSVSDSTYEQQLCSRLYTHPLVQQMVYGYDRTKHSCALMERTLGGVESRVQDVANLAIPVYENYCVPQIDVAYNAYSKGVEGTKYAVDLMKSVVVKTSTLGIGLVVVAAQLSLAFGVAGANLILDSVIASKRIGSSVFSSAQDAEKAMEQRIFTFIQQAQGAVQIPLAKLTEQANSFLDIANAIVDRSLGLNSEADPVDCATGERVMRLGRRLSGAIVNRAHDDVIDPLNNQLHAVIDQFNKSLVLVDLIRERQKWAMEKVDEWHTSINDLRARVDREARELKQKPEEILMRSVRLSSTQLTEKIKALKEKGNQILGESANAKLDAATAYLSHLDETLAHSDDIYQLRDEVITEARTRIAELAEWVRERSSPRATNRNEFN